jgi:plasmid rolling circle replication initiator protein Rep
MRFVNIETVEAVKCSRCRRRQSYDKCWLCSSPLCAMCSWTTVQRLATDSALLLGEQCRKCAEVQW